MILLTSQVEISDFFKYGSFATLAGTAGIVYIICGAIQRAFNYSPRWFALLVSMVISFIAAYIGAITSSKGTYLLAFLNGFLIYMTATGVNQITSPDNQVKGTDSPMVLPKVRIDQPRKFGSNWWHKELRG